MIGTPESHHDRARWAWEFGRPADSRPLAAGVDYATLDPEGRLRTVTGCFDALKLPA